jgi:dihydrofolate reductase
MKVTLVMVASLDGKTTQGSKPGTNSWASPEDQEVFLAQKAAHDCIVMGSATYEAARAIIQPSADKPRIILTRTPERFAGERQPGLVFSADTPQDVIRQIKRDGRKSVLLVGGAQTNVRFLDNGLVDEVVVVIEPLLFGAGRPLVDPLGQTIQLQLVNCERLNSQGALLARYAITNNNRGV